MKSLVPEISSSDSDEAELGRCLKRKKMGGAVDEPRHTFFMALSTLSSAGQKEWIDGGGGSDAVFLSSSAQIPVHPRFGPLVQEMARWEGEMGGAVFTFNVDAHNKRRYHPEFKHDGKNWAGLTRASGCLQMWGGMAQQTSTARTQLCWTLNGT